jgi:hypothetical protein
LDIGQMAASEGPVRPDEPLAPPRELREAVSKKETIRMSPWKINLLARQVRDSCDRQRCR